MALSPWPERSTMPVAWPAAVRQLAASLNQSVPATGSLVDDATSIRLDQLASMVSARAEKEAPGAPQEARDEAIVRAVGYLLQAGTGAIRSKRVEGLETEYTPSNVRWWYNCGASSVLAPWYAPRGGIIG